MLIKLRQPFSPAIDIDIDKYGISLMYWQKYNKNKRSIGIGSFSWKELLLLKRKVTKEDKNAKLC